MGDILSQGGDGERGRWPGRLAAAVLVLLVAVVAVWRLPGRGHAPAAVTPSPVQAIAGTAAADEADGIAGHGVPVPSSLRLPVAGVRPAWLAPSTGHTVPIGGLPPDPSGYRFTRVGGGWAVQAEAAAGPGCGGCAGPALPVYFLASGARPAIPLGSADLVAPAVAAGAVWLTSYPPAADVSTAAGTARLAGAAGAAGARQAGLAGAAGAVGAAQPPVRLPPGYVIKRATVRGLLLAPAIAGPGASDELWDPAAAQVSRVFPRVIAASATRVAWMPACARLCQVQVLDLAAGRQAAVRLPDGSSVASGAFSPSGRFLALQLSYPGAGDDGALAIQLLVASSASGRLTAVPGTSASSDALIGFGWPSGSDSLVAEFSFPGKVQVTSWQPGASRLAVTAIRPGSGQDPLIIG
ncbi:MAG TPA: hypothetical protein VGL63_10860 [Streptosporangiaceae bacterium]|jgi:hypothetical protein